ncbi:hydantoinase/oxoprolinase family protein [Amycolatopsis pithecellobii]|uniref:Hydantoinase/oxoprolinase family protein n=1 Tax=Amycolatopsis pithecellobii TaxID=664692 RepID=A0A6N7YU64_9PSEU|nr:hydantoinase/oxoprolinase family protein [Amycolatopsis pithecellobii]MTD55468.1 hydantoinase/oxoprolinase family protein [Amycolatopsis pithecellobii]
MSYVIGIDVGGTFTDAFATDEHGRVHSAKSPSTPPDFEQGVLSAVDELAAAAGLDTASLLGQTSHICHGTTATLNALVTGDVAEVGFLTTAGHADSIMIMNLEGRYAGRDSDYVKNMTRHTKPQPLVPRRRIREITERVDSGGQVVVPLGEDRARAAIAELIADGAEAFAVSLLWSFSNPAHELRLRELIHEQSPGAYVGLSSELSPRIREYPRNVTTIMGTQVGPRLRDYLVPLRARLDERGFAGSLLVMQGSGGAVTAEEAPDRAITTIGSVLTGGLVGCRNLGRQLGHENIISTDIGGTTFLVGMVVDGEPVKSTTTILNQYTISTPTVKVSTIGSGGGAIAWLDGGGNLRVGPRSAGARPGPACYGAGGTEPTVTDADVVLGIVNPDNFLGGRRRLDRALAEKAIRERIGEPLGLDVEDAAAAIYAIQNAQAADLVRNVVVNAGYDPRDFVVYSFGGAGPVHCVNYSRDLGAKAVVVPLGATAATFSAYGLASSDVVLSGEVSDPANFPVPAESVQRAFDGLEKELRDRMGGQRLPFETVEISREVDVRYSMQLSEVATPVAPGPVDDAAVTAVTDRFDTLYAQLYGAEAGFRAAGHQLITYRCYATGTLPVRPELPAARRGDGKPRPYGRRRAFLAHEDGWQDVDVYRYTDLRAGQEFCGPAVVEADTTTLAVPERTRATVDHLGNLVLSTASVSGKD